MALNSNLITTFEELIQIPSITRNSEERDIVDYSEEKLKGIVKDNPNLSGVEISIEKIEDTDKNGIYHGGVVCHIKVDDSKPTVGLMGHLDVVPVSNNWKTNPFELIEEDDRFLGRGTCDMKSGDAIMIEMLRESLKTKPTKNITLLLTSGEECGIPNGLTEIINSEKVGKLDFAIALEPTDGKVNTGCFGYLDGKFHFKGKSCHSSNPDLGENAIAKMWKLLKYMESPECVNEYLAYNEKLKEAFSATKVNGGIAANTIPDKALVQTNFRYSPDRTGESAEALMKEIAKETGASHFEFLEHDPSSPMVRSDNPLLQEFIKKIGTNTKNVVPFWSDISQTSGLGIPSINFGPGSIEQAHTDNEFILKDSFEKTYQQFRNYIFN